MIVRKMFQKILFQKILKNSLDNTHETPKSAFLLKIDSVARFAWNSLQKACLCSHLVDRFCFKMEQNNLSSPETRKMASNATKTNIKDNQKWQSESRFYCTYNKINLLLESIKNHKVKMETE